MARSTPEQARIRIEFSGIPGVKTSEIAIDVVEDTPEHHDRAVADAFAQAEQELAENKASAGVEPSAPVAEATDPVAEPTDE